MITPEEFEARMKAIDNGEVFSGRIFDEEDTHYAADELMTEVLRELGYGAGCDIFDAMPKWYA